MTTIVKIENISAHDHEAKVSVSGTSEDIEVTILKDFEVMEVTLYDGVKVEIEEVEKS